MKIIGPERQESDKGMRLVKGDEEKNLNEMKE